MKKLLIITLFLSFVLATQSFAGEKDLKREIVDLKLKLVSEQMAHLKTKYSWMQEEARELAKQLREMDKKEIPSEGFKEEGGG